MAPLGPFPVKLDSHLLFCVFFSNTLDMYYDKNLPYLGKIPFLNVLLLAVSMCPASTYMFMAFVSPHRQPEIRHFMLAGYCYVSIEELILTNLNC